MKNQIRLKTLTVAILAALLTACQPSGPAEMITTTATESWKVVTPTLSKAQTTWNVQIDPNAKAQQIDGFGACFNELGWTSLSLLPKATRDSIMSDLFTPGSGANFTLCRMPIAANDFARNWYSYNETEGDFEMKNFSIATDLEIMIPFIKKAQEYNPDLQVWASPWSPPSWMKHNKHYACAVPWESLAPEFHNGLTPDKQGAEGTNMFIQQPEYFNAYALYFTKFIKAYKEQGIDIKAVHVQNEFNSCQIFPSCTWTATGLKTFIGQYLGPEFEKQGLKTQIWMGTIERPSVENVDSIFTDSLASKYIVGAGFQWAGKDAIAGVHAKYPQLKLWQTESECGDGLNDWKHCMHTWSLMKHYLSNGANAYLYWNISLDETGLSRWGWKQNSLVSVNPNTRTFKYNYEYYLMKHLSRYVAPGAYRVQPSGSFNNLLAFINPDGSIVLLAANETDAPVAVEFNVKGSKQTIEIEPQSVNTLVWK